MTRIVTITNKGYIDYTLNCLKSFEKSGLDPNILECWCIDEEVYNQLKELSYNAILIPENDFMFKDGKKVTELAKWGQISFGLHVTIQKFYAIYEVLKNNEDVLFLDGDIVIENPEFVQYFIDNIKDNDLLIQDENHKNIKCSGVMYIKSTETTKKYFNPKNVNYQTTTRWTDQTYINSILHLLKYKLIDSNLFPNGKYYYEKHATLNPYLIHFNFLVGHEKKKKMQHFKKWYND
tara:strand:- start:215 stop:919 length:705 start_codon:yes stop_codon:yes gene_type:complete